MHFDEFAFFFFACLYLRCMCYCLNMCVRSIFFTFGVHVYICACCRCMACVASSWGCQWNTDDHTCSDMDNMVGPNIIKHRQVGLHITTEWLFYLRWYVLIKVEQKCEKTRLIATHDAETERYNFLLKINIVKSWYQLAPSCVTNVVGRRLSIYKSVDVSEIFASVLEVYVGVGVVDGC